MPAIRVESNPISRVRLLSPLLTTEGLAGLVQKKFRRFIESDEHAGYIYTGQLEVVC